MNAVIETGGKQYIVSKDQILYVELLEQEVGEEVKLNNILAVYDDNKIIQLGSPTIEGTSITAKIQEEIKGPKVRGFKYKRRKGYHRRWGHRQRYYRLKILSINTN